MNKFGFIFPGQGSQSVGMLDAYNDRFFRIKAICKEVGELLGYDFWKLIHEGPKEQLDQTIYTQPAVMVSSCLMWQIWESTDLKKKPVMAAGHSLGEYSALVAAKVFTFEDALMLVAKRAELMQNAVPQGTGAMAAILGLSSELVQKACEDAAESEVVSPANFNAPGQIVIAGHKAAVERAITQAKALGAKRAILLPVSVPSHCALMQPAAEAFIRYLEEIPMARPQFPVIHNVSVDSCSHPDDIREALSKQLVSPVRWTETIQLMHEEGISTLYECGPGTVLSGLNKRINAHINSVALEKPLDELAQAQ